MNYISILVGISLCALLMMSVMQSLLTAKKTFFMYQKHAQVLNTAQTAMQYFSRDIKSAGYRGWRSGDLSFPLSVHLSEWNQHLAYLVKEKAVWGFTAKPGVCYGKMPITACKRVKENSAVLILYQVAQKINPLLRAVQKLDEPLMLPSHHGIHKGALVLVSDGLQGDLFITNNIKGSFIFHEKRLGLNQSDCLSKSYTEGAEVSEVQTVAYYLAVPERLQLSGSAISSSFSLFRDDFLQNAQEIIAGVKEIDFEYGIQDAVTEELKYYKPEEISEEKWNLVQTVRVLLTLEKGEEGDRSQSWNFEIAIRNRILPYLNFGVLDPCFLDWHSYGISRSSVV